jgi:hypothetical protein
MNFAGITACALPSHLLLTAELADRTVVRCSKKSNAAASHRIFAHTLILLTPWQHTDQYCLLLGSI